MLRTLRYSAIGLAAGSIISLSLLTPLLVDGQGLVKIRNSLIFKIDEDDPSAEQPVSRRAPVPVFFQDVTNSLRLIGKPNTFERSLLIARHMRSGKPNRGGAIQERSVIAYQQILAGNGYCADYSQVFMALASAAGITAREWGMSFDGYGGDGHAFNEVYSDEYHSWIFIDTFYGFYVTDSSSKPLSYAGFREHLINKQTRLLRVVPLDARFRFTSASKAFAYYTRGAHESYLWTNNDVFAYEAEPVVKALDALPPAIEQAVAIVMGVFPVIELDATVASPIALAALVRVRRAVLATLSLGTLAVGTLSLAVLLGRALPPKQNR